MNVVAPTTVKVLQITSSIQVTILGAYGVRYILIDNGMYQAELTRHSS